MRHLRSRVTRRLRRARGAARARGQSLRGFQPRSCLGGPSHEIARALVPAVDGHAHLGRWLTGGKRWLVPDVKRFLDQLDEVGVTTVVNLDGLWGAELEENLRRYDAAHPSRFVTFCQLDWSQATTPGFSSRLIRGLERSAASGAAGVKVWKDLGLTVRDDRDRLLLPDDPRLDDVWAAAGELDLPVLIHTADPVAFFQPVDRHNERLEELLAHPEWSLAHQRYPRFQRLIDALEAVVAAHPGTTFVGAHVGGWAENLEWVDKMLSAHPNFAVDIAGRIAELGRQPRAATALIRAHPDQILFGADAMPPSTETYRIYFRVLETGDEHFDYSTEPVPPQGRWRVSGLELPADVLGAVYGGNARRLIPRLRLR